MAEYGDEVRQEYGEGDDSLEETTAANVGANNSIIGKMKSSVTSILPNSLSKWFSPSSNNNSDSANGSYIKRTRSETDANTPYVRIDRRSEMARRRIAINDYAEEDDDDGDGDGDELEDDEAAEESNHSDDIQISATSASVQRRRHLNLVSPTEVDQPPSKRSRLSLDGTMISSRPLIASTPAINAQRGSGVVNNHYGHLNMYSGVNRKELGYNFYNPTAPTSSFVQQNVAPDIIDLIPIPMSSGSDILSVRKGNQHIESETARTRRALNIPPTGMASLGSTYSGRVLPTLKRQSLNAVNTNSSLTDSRQNADIQNYDHKNEPIVLDPALELDEVLLESQTYNGSDEPKFQNGASDFEEELRHRSLTDSEAEDADTIAELPTNTSIHSLKADMASQRAASSGLFNMSTGNSRSGSRTSSFGNGLNFYTHLEGRKSLFAGNNLRGRTNTGNALNCSTLSLNSLNRRQFNASIYGSTSALSDSRLLNTSSPFYKGNTTYGGAAAYSKYTTSLGSNSRLTPTLIRPTSSLSTLSSSSNSIAAGTGMSIAHGEQNPAISGTAKTILDLLNGFTTPLSEAKKMASSLRQQPLSSTSSPNTKSKRLSDSDLHTSRAMRLQQVRTPYTRPAVMLQPKKSTSESQMPPVKELQVPSMSQLLQMKKLQTLTERSRQITMQKSNKQECSVPTLPNTIKPIVIPIEIQKPSTYTLPTISTIEPHTAPNNSVIDISMTNDCKQQKHVNKIKHKITNPLRVPDIPDESPPMPVNLPNIAFPLMTQMPKIDIALPTISKQSNTQSIGTMGSKINAIPFVESAPKHITHNFKFSPPDDLKDMPSSVYGVGSSTMNFEFSKPVPLEATNLGITALKTQKQSEDITVVGARPSLPSTLFALPKSLTSPTAVPTLKTGSVLDALKKPIALPKSSSIETAVSIKSQPLSSFGSQFKKASNEWECDTCMIRNNENAQKCVACETSRKGISVSTNVSQKPFTTTAPLMPFATGFGDQFKKQSGEWECDTCMVRNKPELDKCVSCETARKGEAKPMSHSDAPKPFGQSTFGNSLKPILSATNAVASDSGFKSLAAAQQASKWECEACMTRNESSRSKCACCEQPKPGTENQKENAPSFNFGTTATTKFSFGFGAGATDPAKQNELQQKTSDSSANTTKSVEKPVVGMAAPSKGFTVGIGTGVTTTQSNTFSFGFQTKPTTAPEKSSVISSKDTSDSSTKAPAFSFGLANSDSPKAISTSAFSATTSKDELPVTSTATSTTSSSAVTTTVTTTLSSCTPPKVASFSFGNASTTTTQSSSTLATTKPQNGLAFGFQTSATSTVASTLTTVSSTSGIKLFFPTTPKVVVTTGTSTPIVSSTATNSVSGTIATTGAAFNFGAVSTSATSTTTTTKPMFSFGAPSVPSTSTGSVSSTTVTVPTTGGAVINSTSISGGSVGFGFTNSTPTVTASNTMATTNSPFSINPSANGNSSSNITTFAPFSSPKSSMQSAITTATTTAAPAFGGFSFGGGTTTSPKAESGNLFGTHTPKTQGELKPIASAVPIFGSAAGQAELKSTTSNSWPKNAFLFGSPASTATAKVAADGSNEPVSKAVFGSLKAQTTESATPINNINATASIFGSVGTASSGPSFGNSNAASSVIFGKSTAQPPTNTTNLFGSNNNTIPQFGTISSGQSTLGNNSTANATPAFGNTTAMGFGSFGAAAVTATATSTTNSDVNTQSSATPFAFGASQPQSTSSGFNFGATAATSRPAFNFTSTNQPTFNFTGSSTETTQNSTRPFQFGATAAPSFNAPSVFSFGGAPSTETTSNTPFQFNAGSSSATSNIFAPAPTASTTIQAARRKVRIPTRRLPPR